MTIQNTAWQSTANIPADRAVLVRSDVCPFGVRHGDMTINFGQRGNGSKPGLWAGGHFWADKPKRGDPGSAIWSEWAEIPA